MIPLKISTYGAAAAAIFAINAFKYVIGLITSKTAPTKPVLPSVNALPLISPLLASSFDKSFFPLRKFATDIFVAAFFLAFFFDLLLESFSFFASFRVFGYVFDKLLGYGASAV